MARVLGDSLQKFVATLLEWMRRQYRFHPVEVELPFGEPAASPAALIDLSNGRKLELRGRIDRVDVFREPGADTGYYVVIDYKSGHKQLDDVSVANGLQLQLLAYLNVLRNWDHAKLSSGVKHLDPAGVFYVSLRGRYERQRHRSAALQDVAHARKLAYMHCGRFDNTILPLLDARPNVTVGDQFNYRLKADRKVSKGCREALPPASFQRLIDSVEHKLRELGEQIFAGTIKVDPFRKGTITACDQCGYLSVCRLDPWTHSFRKLKEPD